MRLNIESSCSEAHILEFRLYSVRSGGETPSGPSILPSQARPFL